MIHYFHWTGDENKKSRIRFGWLLKNVANIPDAAYIPGPCQECSESAFWRKSEKDKWNCYYCEPPGVDIAAKGNAKFSKR